jgi:hypothetical protein
LSKKIININAEGAISLKNICLSEYIYIYYCVTQMFFFHNVFISFSFVHKIARTLYSKFDLFQCTWSYENFEASFEWQCNILFRNFKKNIYLTYWIEYLILF